MIKRLALALCLATTSIQTATASHPDLGDPAFASIAPQELSRLDKSFKQQLMQSGKIIADPLLQQYLNRLVLRLNQANPAGAQRWQIVLINDSNVNAFASLNGLMGLHAGTWLLSETESELAAVLAHELAHLSRNHLVHKLAYSKDQRTPATLGSLLAVAAGLVAPQLGAGALAAMLASATDKQLQFSRSQEQEADRLALSILYHANFNPHALTHFFNKMLQQQYAVGTLPPEFLRSHPTNLSRIADTESHAARFKTKAVKSSLDYQLFKQRLLVLTTQTPDKLMASYQHDLHAKKVSPAKRYGYSLLLLKQHRYQQALAQTTILLKQYPEQSSFLLNKADILQRLRRDQEAIGLLQQQLELFPEDIGLLISYNKALLHSKQAKKCINSIQSNKILLEQQPALLALLARCQAKANQHSEANLTQAKLLIKLAQKKRAKELLTRLAKSSEPTQAEKAKVLLRQL